MSKANKEILQHMTESSVVLSVVEPFLPGSGSTQKISTQLVKICLHSATNLNKKQYNNLNLKKALINVEDAAYAFI